MRNAFRKTGPRDFFLLKLSYQLLLLWLPLLVGALSLAFGGYYFSALLAVQLGIDPDASIISQPHAQQFAIYATCIFGASGITGMGIAYSLVCLILKVVQKLDSSELLVIFRGAAYPVGWFESSV